MKKNILVWGLALLVGLLGNDAYCQIINAYGRANQSLNGEWHAIVDPFDRGRSMGIYKNVKPVRNNQFREYSFDEGLILNVPGDYNSQHPELKYYEGPVWYGRYFDIEGNDTDGKLLLYFAGIANAAHIYLNGELIGSHEGAFTPFQIDITDKVKESDNFLAVYTDNRRHKDDIPAMNFDWWNYGGITRDVMILRVPHTYISDYFIRLDNKNPDVIEVDVALSDSIPGREITVDIPELKVRKELKSDDFGKASASVQVKKIRRWDIDDPKLYEVTVTAGRDTVREEIGFRTIETRGKDIILNGRPVFLRGVNVHEEIPQRKGRAFSEADAAMLLSEAKELGANFLRLAHYPQNEYTVRLAEKMGFLLWEEIPVWQNIDFSNDETLSKAERMLRDMIARDKNRAAIGIWSIANETTPNRPRNEFLSRLKDVATDNDGTRLVAAAFNNPKYNSETRRFELNGDPVPDILDVVGVNKYIGWYNDWPAEPSDVEWSVAADKPLIFSEFGGEALYGNHGNEDAKWSWSEDFQAKLYSDNIKMFENIPNLAGVCPWVLFDFMSPTRFSPQQGLEFNRKGLVSDKGLRKKAWYVMRNYYNSKKQSLH